MHCQHCASYTGYWSTFWAAVQRHWKRNGYWWRDDQVLKAIAEAIRVGVEAIQFFQAFTFISAGEQTKTHCKTICRHPVSRPRAANFPKRIVATPLRQDTNPKWFSESWQFLGKITCKRPLEKVQKLCGMGALVIGRVLGPEGEEPFAMALRKTREGNNGEESSCPAIWTQTGV